MFVKPFRTKSSSQMKGSDKKKFKSAVAKRFFPNLNGTSLPDRLMGGNNKEEMTVTKISTFSGQNVVVYFVGKDPLFFQLEKEKRLLPTVYSLRRCPELAAVTFEMTDGVLAKIQNGADLMLPGVVVDLTKGIRSFGDGRLKRGDLVSCVAGGGGAAVVAVGTAAHDSEDLYMAAMRGKAVIVLHCVGDHLWLSGSKQQVVATDSTPPPPPPPPPQQLESGTEEKDDDDDPEPDEEEEDCGRNQADLMDELIENSFLQALKTTATAKKLELPVLTSTFYRSHMVPAAAAVVGSSSSSTIDLKKSSFKKLGRFLAKMQDDKVIVVKEQKKGVEVIANVDYDNEKVVTFRPVKLDHRSSTVEEIGGYRPPVVTELNFVTAQVVDFFRACGRSKGDGLTSAEVRECVRDYVKKEKLDNDDPSVVNLDPVLAHAVLVKGENLVVKFRWDKLTSRITSKMTRGYSMDFGGGGGGRIAAKGKLECVEMCLGSRSGNKKVTLVHNLDVYGVDLHEFAHRCQVGVAASTAVHEARNKKRAGGQPVMEVLIQGNQVAFVTALLLDHYNIPRKYVRGTELAAKAVKSKGGQAHKTGN